MRKNGIRLIVIGDRSRFDPDIVTMIERAETDTADGARLNLILALSYGGRQEIASAARSLAKQVAAGELDPDAIDDDEGEEV